MRWMVLFASFWAGCSNAPGVPCSDPDGTASCSGGAGRACCGGREIDWYDGVCRPPDAALPDGGSPCAVPTVAGCPCATEGEVACAGIYDWRRECHGGVWTEVVGEICCPG